MKEPFHIIQPRLKIKSSYLVNLVRLCFFADALVKAKERALVTLESRTWAIATQGRGVRTRFSRRESSCSLPLVRNRSRGWDAWITR